MKKYDPDGFAAIKGILVGLVLSAAMVFGAGLGAKVLWRAFLFGWELV